MTATKTMFVIEINGQPMPTNDRDDRYLMVRSKAHGKRVIEWLGLTGAKIVAATEEQEASGKYCEVHGRFKGDLGK